MKKLILTAFIAILPIVSLAKASTGKVAVINIEQAILSTKEAQSKITQLEADAEFKKNLAQLKKIQEEGQKLTEQYKKDGQLMSSTDVRALEEKIKTKQSDLEHVGRKLQEARNNLMKGLMIEMNEDMSRFVKEIIDAEKIGLLLPYNPQLILHADASFDITEKINSETGSKKEKIMPTLSELAETLQAIAVGTLDLEVQGLASLDKASATDISFLSNNKFLDNAKASSAGIMVVNEEAASSLKGKNLLIHKNPYFCFAQLTEIFNTAPTFKPGIHHSAVIADTAKIAPSVSIGANVVIGDQVIIAENTIVEANTVINDRCQIGAYCHLHNQVSLYHDVILGDEVVIHSGSVIGSDGFGYAPMFSEQRKWHKIQQLGTVKIGDRVEIGAATTIDRGALEDTVIANDVIIDNHVHIGHNCIIGEGTAIAGCVGIAGSSIIGKFCSLAGGVGIAGHLEIANHTTVTGMTMVTKSITQPGSYSAGTPMMTTKDWRKSAVRFSQLEKLNRRVKKLED